MQNVSFKGMLTIPCRNEVHSLDTDHIVRTSKNQDTEGIQIYTDDGQSINIDGSYTFGEIQKGILLAKQGGEHTIKSNSLDLYNCETTSTKNNCKETKNSSGPYKNTEIQENGTIVSFLDADFREKYGINKDNYTDIIEEVSGDLDLCPKQDGKTNAIIQKLDNVFNNIQGLNEGISIYKAINRQILDDDILQAKAGDTITLSKGYTIAESESTFPNKGIPDYFSSAVFEIRCPKGAKIAEIPAEDTNGKTKEFLMPRQASFKVISKQEVPQYEAYDSLGELDKPAVTKYVLEYIEK